MFVAEVGDVTRFASAAQLACWAGLTPKHHESDTHVHRGRITKQGSRLVRWAAVESVKQILPATPWSARSATGSPPAGAATSASWPPPAGRSSSSSTRCATTTSAPCTAASTGRHDAAARQILVGRGSCRS